MKRKMRIAAGVLALGLAVGLFAMRSTIMAALFLQQSPGSFDRSWCEAVVQQVRALGIAPGETRELRLDALRDPSSLRLRRPGEMPARGEGAGYVWAARTPDGKLAVVIETRDLGHAGEYGFAYTEAPASPKPYGGNWQSLDVPGHLTFVLPQMRIDDHWWEVVYNLD
jgi:hypothetical protein